MITKSVTLTNDLVLCLAHVAKPTEPNNTPESLGMVIERICGASKEIRQAYKELQESKKLSSDIECRPVRGRPVGAKNKKVNGLTSHGTDKGKTA